MPQCQLAFDRMKQLLTMHYSSTNEPFLLEMGASGTQNQEDGAVMPIAYASRSLQPHEKNCGITELEFGVVWAVKHFRPYL